VFVAAAGNEATNTDQVPHSPSGLAGVLSVGASDDTGNRASFSNFGASTVDLFAPGVQILSADAFSTSGRVRFSGTSMASPVVAGALASLADANPKATAAQLKQSVLSTVVQRQALQGLALSGGVLANSFTGAFTAPLSSDVSGAAPVLPAPDSGGSSGRAGRKVRRGRSGRRSVAGTAICLVEDSASKADVDALLDRRVSTEDVEWPAAFGNRICILRYDPEQDSFKAVRQQLKRSGLFESIERDYIVSIAVGGAASASSADGAAVPGVMAGALELAGTGGMPLL
jgi:subtilisin family serine protease